MATESIASATCFLDPHPGQDFERKASRESTTKLKDLGPRTVSVIHLFSLLYNVKELLISSEGGNLQ